MQYDGSIYVNDMQTYGNEKTYTVVSAPTKKDFGNFYSVLWQQNIDTVVVLGKLEENKLDKIDQWWEVGNHGPFTVHRWSREETESDTRWESFQIFATKKGDMWNIMSLKVLWYQDWPDHGVPDPGQFRALHKKYLSLEPKHILVHCSAGVGRTGTFITYDRAKDHEGSVTVPLLQDIINQLRTKRGHMVQHSEQYRFLLDLFNLSTENFKADYKKLYEPTKLKNVPSDLCGVRYSDIHSQPPYIQLNQASASKPQDLPTHVSADDYKQLNHSGRPAIASSSHGSKYPENPSQTPPYIRKNQDSVSKLGTRSLLVEPTSATDQMTAPKQPPTSVTSLFASLSPFRTPQNYSAVPGQLTSGRLLLCEAPIANNVIKMELKELLRKKLGNTNPCEHRLSEMRLNWLVNWIYDDDLENRQGRLNFVYESWNTDKKFKPFVLHDSDKPRLAGNMRYPFESIISQTESEALIGDSYLYRLSGSKAGLVTLAFSNPNIRERIGYLKLPERIKALEAAGNHTSLYSKVLF
jgi:hypothetical protein